jgi:hypothetical protein
METYFKNQRLQDQACAAKICSQAAAVWDARIPRNELPSDKNAKNAYISSVIATINSRRKEAKLSQLPTLADSDILKLGAAEDVFFAAVSLSGKGLPLPIGTSKPQLAVARAQSIHNLRPGHVTALGFAASLNAPLHVKGWTKDFAARTRADANSLVTQLDPSLDPFALASFNDLLASFTLLVFSKRAQTHVRVFLAVISSI